MGNTKEIKIDAMGEFMLTIRKDALNRMPWDRLLYHIRPQTNLNQDDYKELRNAMLRRIVLQIRNGKIEVETEDIGLRKCKRRIVDVENVMKVQDESAITRAKKDYEKFKKEHNQTKK